jgi:hypothetical protein
MSILNAARSGKFSSDRTIQEYCDDIWRIKPVPIRIFGEHNGDAGDAPKAQEVLTTQQTGVTPMPSGRPFEDGATAGAETAIAKGLGVETDIIPEHDREYGSSDAAKEKRPMEHNDKIFQPVL